MCDPVSMAAVMSAAKIGGSVMSFVGQQQAYGFNEKMANLQFANTSNAETIKTGEVNQQQSEQDVTNAVNQAQAFGKIAASGTSSAAGRGTIGAAETSAGITSARQFGLTQQQGTAQRQQVGTELQGANLQRTSQINSMQKPSLASLVLGIVGGGVSGGQTYYASGGKDLGGDLSSTFSQMTGG